MSVTDLAVYQQPAAELVPISHGFDDWIPVLQQVVGLAEAIADSPFVPEGLRNSVPAVAAAILTGRELGIPPMTALANIHLIKGKTGLSALLMRALVQSRGHHWEDVQVTDTRVVVRGKRRGEAEWTEASFDADQAKRAGIQLHPYPQDKLYARASVRLARRKFADVIAGMPYSAEELEDGVIEQTETLEPAPAEKPAARTAQRRQPAAPKTPAAGAAPPPSGIPSPPPQDQPGLPPLPGEEDDGVRDVRDRCSSGQRGIILQHFKRLGFAEDERDQRLAATAAIAGLPEGVVLGSTSDLTEAQAKAVMDTLARVRDRERLIVLLAAGDTPDDTT